MNLFDEAAPVETKAADKTAPLWRGSKCRVDHRGQLWAGDIDCTRHTRTSLLGMVKFTFVCQQRGPGCEIETFNANGTLLNRVTTDLGEVYWMPARK